jgi:hypothetical protein
MAKTRALMTQTERDRIAGVEDVEDIKRYQAITRVRGRIEDELTEDIRILEENHEGLLAELREVVCTQDERDTETPPQVEENTGVHSQQPTRSPVQEARGDAERALEEKGLSDTKKDAVLAAWEHLRSRESSQKSVFIKEVYPDHHAGYADRELKNPEHAWWKNVIDEHLPDLPNVEKPSKEGAHTWHYTGDFDGN